MPSWYKYVIAAFLVLLASGPFAQIRAQNLSLAPQAAQSIDNAIRLRNTLLSNGEREQAYLPDNPYLKRTARQAAISRADGDLASAVVATIAAYPAQARAIAAYARQQAPDAAAAIQAAIATAYPGLFAVTAARPDSRRMPAAAALPARTYGDIPPPQAIPLPASLYNQPALKDYQNGNLTVAAAYPGNGVPLLQAPQQPASPASPAGGGDTSNDMPEADIIWDPLEPANVSVFSFNEVADLFFMRPLAQIYSYTPEIVKTGIANALFNLREPVNAANSLLQGAFGEAGTTLARFGINTTIGVLGFYDAAADLIGWQPKGNDFGATLHAYGLGAGPYLDLPLIGPSNIRDAVGLVVDTALDPKTYLLTPAANYGIAAAGGLSQREALLEPLDELRRSSLDYYTALQGAYYQRRAAQFSGASGGNNAAANELFDNFE